MERDKIAQFVSYPRTILERGMRYSLIGLVVLLSLSVWLSPRNSVGAATDAAPALPADCTGLAEPGSDPPEMCVYGHVLLDGLPMSGAEVLIHSARGVLSLTTQTGPDSPDPYFAAALDTFPLRAVPTDTLTISANVSGQSGETTFWAYPGVQQVDVWASTSCGPTTVLGGTIVNNTTWRRLCSPYILAGNVMVANWAELTIEPGVTVRVEADKALGVEGKINTTGEAQAMVRFTSNGLASPGAWGYILLDSATDGSKLDYTLVEYAGGADVSTTGALILTGGNIRLEHLVIRESASDGLLANYAIFNLLYSRVLDNAGCGVRIKSLSSGLSVAWSEVARNQGGGINYSGETGSDLGIAYNTINENLNGPGVRIYHGNVAVIGNTIADNSAGNGAGISVQYGNVTIGQNLIARNNSTGNGGGIYLAANPGYVTQNLIVNNYAKNDGGGIHASYSYGETHMIFNVVAGNECGDAGGGINIPYAAVGSQLAYNHILANQSNGHGGGLNLTDTDVEVVCNTIANNQAGDGLGGVYIKNYPPFVYNNLHHNTDFDLYNGNGVGSPDLLVVDNYWGVTPGAMVAYLVYDWYDDASLGIASYIPILAGPNIAAPPAPPTGLIATAVDDRIDLSWGPNEESDHAGYLVYYDTDQPGYPYDGSGAHGGDSPIDVGNVTDFTLNGLPAGRYYLAVTAYDHEADGTDDWFQSHESWFSNEVYAGIGAAPTAGFSAAPLSGLPPLTVSFTDTSSVTVDSWDWDFGDGGVSASQNPTHTYTTTGQFTVTLTVEGPVGSDSLTRINLIDTEVAPQAAFSAEITEGIAPLEVGFTDLSTGVYDFCSWNFGDGGTLATCGDVSHTYIQKGVYDVSLTISGTYGSDSSLQNDLITIFEPVAADFSQSANRGAAPLYVEFTNESSGDFDACSWDLGNGYTSLSCSGASTIFTQAGTYTANLNRFRRWRQRYRDQTGMRSSHIYNRTSNGRFQRCTAIWSGAPVRPVHRSVDWRGQFLGMDLRGWWW